MELDNKSIGERIQKERKSLGLSQEELAEIIGLSNYYIGQLERGERQMSLPVLVKMANCLHISLDYLVFGVYFDDINYVNETSNDYKSYIDIKNKEIIKLINKCSPNELELFKKLIKTILPYIK